MRLIPILILFILSCKAQAQQGVRVSPIAALEYHSKHHGFLSDGLFRSSSFQVGTWNYRVGLNFNFPINNSLTIISGIHFFQLGTTKKYPENSFLDNLNVSPISVFPVYEKSIRNVRGIPFYLRLSKDYEKYFLFAESGFSANFTYNIVKKRLATENGEVMTDVELSNEVFIFLKLALGIGCKISNKINLSASPLVRYRPREFFSYNNLQVFRFTYGLMIKTEILLK